MDDQELFQRASFGKEIEAFWGSRIGEYLKDRAREIYVLNLTELKTVDPTDTKKVAFFQNEVWKAEMFEKWLSEAVLDGLKSLEILESENED